MPSLYKETGKKKEKFEAAVDLLSKLVKNIIENPTEDKYRSFKKVGIQKIKKKNRKTLKSKKNSHAISLESKLSN